MYLHPQSSCPALKLYIISVLIFLPRTKVVYILAPTLFSSVWRQCCIPNNIFYLIVITYYSSSIGSSRLICKKCPTYSISCYHNITLITIGTSLKLYKIYIRSKYYLPTYMPICNNFYSLSAQKSKF